MRWTPEASRTIRSAWDAFPGIDSFSIKSLSIWRDQDGRRWRTFEARDNRTNPVTTLRVLERIYDNVGQSWLDISSWYWAELLRQTHGPWWNVTIVETQHES